MVSVPALPFPFPLRVDEAALLVIDMQRDFVEPGGFGESLGNDVRPLQAIIPVIADLLALFRQQGLPVIHTRECHRPDLTDCPKAKRNRGDPPLRIGDDGPMGRLLIAGEHGAGIVDALAPIAGETMIDKPGKGAFHATPLGDELVAHRITQLVVAGVTTEVCVQSTIREANDRGFECLLVTDATESYFPAFKQATIDMLTAQGAIGGWATSSGELMEVIR
ncbi:cysteine hydrolase family protein [Ahrensia sp. R2A130]|uniref:cysteine hydrolase family protein n=1 Tax=Ahrensia sp. R2A130 TaxID=744979 RepID=UPI0001E0E046|nr:isochorismatase family cysteine hydrolase [Ahrensia sp. R2A130]EFL90901.1 isochorismatase hydrolase [Ahrensia sp. R2A130]